MRISVLMLTHCAPRYVKQSIVTLKKRTDFAPGYELIVADNDSDRKTRRLLSRLYFNGLIDKLAYAGENLMFARGNNVAAELCSAESEYVLLLNSDIEVRRADWMTRMVEQMESDSRVAVVGLGNCNDDMPRCDGFAMLVRKELYLRYKLDENFAWWWSVTRLQAQISRDGWKILAVPDYEHLLYHFGGKSPQAATAGAKGMDTAAQEVYSWFEGLGDLYREVQIP